MDHERSRRTARRNELIQLPRWLALVSAARGGGRSGVPRSGGASQTTSACCCRRAGRASFCFFFAPSCEGVGGALFRRPLRDRRFAQRRRVAGGETFTRCSRAVAQSWAFGGLTEHLLNWQSALHCALLQASCRFSHVLCMQGVCLAKSVLLVGGVWQRFDRRDWHCLSHCHSSGRPAEPHATRPGTSP